MSKRRAWLSFIVSVALVLFIVVFVLTTHEAAFSRASSSVFDVWRALLVSGDKHESTSKEWVVVRRVVDGDTIELIDGRKLRYIGINTPESVDPCRPVQCFGKEASLYNRQLVEGKSVRLEKDISESDKYGRLLRYVFLDDGTLVNERLVREGYAYASPFPPDIAKKELFKEAEVDARTHERGLWSPETCDGKK